MQKLGLVSQHFGVPGLQLIGRHCVHFSSNRHLARGSTRMR
jgi:hypothetical protein